MLDLHLPPPHSQWLPSKLEGAELLKAKRSLDQAMLANPYVAGQQLLVASFGCALGGGCAVVDGLAQARNDLP